MIKENKQDLKTLFKNFEGKKCLILTKFKIHYTITNLKVGDDSISFTDKFGNSVLLAISEIAQITEVKNGS